MRWPRLLTIGITTLAIAGAALAGQNTSAELRKVLTNLPDKSVRCGAMVVDLQTGKTLVNINADEQMVPASNQKLLVMTSAGLYLGQSFAFRTDLMLDGDNLILVGDGDPSLGDPRIAESMNEQPLDFLGYWAKALVDQGHANLAGDFIVDATVLDEQFVHPDWSDNDLLRWYGAPIGGLNLNDNCVELTAWPGDAGSPARWELFPPCSLAQVENRCVSAPGTADATPVIGRRPGTFELVLSGKVGERGTLQSVPVHEPNRFAAAAIREYLETQGVHVAGATRFERVRTPTGELPARPRVIAEHVTPLPVVLKRIGVNSQNMFAETLFKRLGGADATRRNNAFTPGSWDAGRLVVQDMLRRMGVDPNEVVIADASGLSRSNRISAHNLVRILQYVYASDMRDMIVHALAGNRNGGTLGARLQKLDADVYAKTGYIRGVRTLSGFVKTTDDKWYAFSVLFNGFKGGSAPYNRIHDEVCRILADTAGTPPA